MFSQSRSQLPTLLGLSMSFKILPALDWPTVSTCMATTFGSSPKVLACLISIPPSWILSTHPVGMLHHYLEMGISSSLLKRTTLGRGSCIVTLRGMHRKDLLCNFWNGKARSQFPWVIRQSSETHALLSPHTPAPKYTSKMTLAFEEIHLGCLEKLKLWRLMDFICISSRMRSGASTWGIDNDQGEMYNINWKCWMGNGKKYGVVSIESMLNTSTPTATIGIDEWSIWPIEKHDKLKVTSPGRNVSTRICLDSKSI